MAKIGFIGLGNMGGPMAANLIKAGHALNVFDLSEAAVSKAVAEGAPRHRRLPMRQRMSSSLSRFFLLESTCCRFMTDQTA